MKLSEVLVDVGKCSVKRQLIAKKGQLIAKKRHLIESSVICSVVFLVLASLISSCDGVPLFGSQKPHGNNISGMKTFRKSCKLSVATYKLRVCEI